MHLLYNLGIRLYGLAIRIASLFNPRAKKWVEGRRGWRQQLTKAKDKIGGGFWFHCASLGEFEQGRPLMEELKQRFPETPLVVSFFSPSGYEQKKRFPLADYVCYLPLDTPSNARFFLNAVQPKAAFFVKYEFWTNFLLEIKASQAPLYCISANFRANQRFFTKKNPFYTLSLRCFSHFFVQNEDSASLLHKINLQNVTVTGDTRFDRVWRNAAHCCENEVLGDFINNNKVLILGSSWAAEHEIVLPLINDERIQEKVIIAPHEVTPKSLKEIEDQLKVPNFRYSCYEDYSKKSHKRVMIIDGVGMLANAYSQGNYALIGGAFGSGLHNILEPAVFGLPVIFGPNYEKFPEAQEFIDEGIGFSIKNQKEFLEARTHILDNLEELKSRTKAFVASKLGATEAIMKVIENDLNPNYN